MMGKQAGSALPLPGTYLEPTHQPRPSPSLLSKRLWSNQHLRPLPPHYQKRSEGRPAHLRMGTLPSTEPKRIRSLRPWPLPGHIPLYNCVVHAPSLGKGRARGDGPQ
jgi:hypothetical protein